MWTEHEQTTSNLVGSQAIYYFAWDYSGTVVISIPWVPAGGGGVSSFFAHFAQRKKKPSSTQANIFLARTENLQPGRETCYSLCIFVYVYVYVYAFTHACGTRVCRCVTFQYCSVMCNFSISICYQTNLSFDICQSCTRLAVTWRSKSRHSSFDLSLRSGPSSCCVIKRLCQCKRGFL